MSKLKKSLSEAKQIQGNTSLRAYMEDRENSRESSSIDVINPTFNLSEESWEKLMHQSQYIVMMHPNHFLDMAQDMTSQTKAHMNHMVKYQAKMINHEGIDACELWFDEKWRCMSHDGRHRAKAAHLLGIKLIPVIVHPRGYGSWEPQILRAYEKALKEGDISYLNEVYDELGKNFGEYMALSEDHVVKYELDQDLFQKIELFHLNPTTKIL